MKRNAVKMMTSLMTAGLMISGVAVVPAEAAPQSRVELSGGMDAARPVLRQERQGVKITNHTIEKKIPEASIKVDYPQISGLKHKSVQKKINKLLKDKAEAFVASALKEAKAGQPTTPSGNPYEYVGTYKVTYNRDGVLSLYVDQYAYTGGAHGITVREGLTFRLDNGKLLTLDELLRANPNYRSIVDPEIAKKLQETDGYFGNFKTIGPNPSYYVQGDGVTIFFQLYDYVPYAFGFPEFHFPFAKLLPPGTNPFDFKTH